LLYKIPLIYIECCFGQVCLKHYDYNPEAVINAVLENNLPPHLNEGHNISDQQPIPEPFVVALDEQTDISKKTRTKYHTE
jgi:hypothetical protein